MPILLKESKWLLSMVYSWANEIDIASMNAHRFMQNKSIQLKSLPPTEDAYVLHTQDMSSVLLLPYLLFQKNM